jgi:hypothetical protein
VLQPELSLVRYRSRLEGSQPLGQIRAALVPPPGVEEERDADPDQQPDHDDQ